MPGKVYEVVYRTRRCPVVGAGLLAVRDCAAFLRYSDAADNPCAGRIDHAYAFGMSQSGRFLRHFLHLGLNVDEAGRQVYDGLHIHVAGARRGEFNHRYAQPSEMHAQMLRPPAALHGRGRSNGRDGWPDAAAACTRRRAEGDPDEYRRRVLARRRLAHPHRHRRDARYRAARRRAHLSVREHAARPRHGAARRYGCEHRRAQASTASMRWITPRSSAPRSSTSTAG